MTHRFLTDTIGNTPLIRLRQPLPNNNRLYAKLEGNNPAGSVKDRPAYRMIDSATKQGDIRPGDRLVEATSGNTGIALAMVAAASGYKMTLIMPTNQTEERKKSMHIYGAELILVSEEEGMEGARDRAAAISDRGDAYRLDQFANLNNPAAHYHGTAPEIWRDTGGSITHFVSAMGTTGTITGCSQFFKEKNPTIQIVGVQPSEGTQIPGIRKWPAAYVPSIYNPSNVDRILYVNQTDAEQAFRQLALKEGLFCGISSGAAHWVAQQLSTEVENATIVFIACDRGDRYVSTFSLDQH